jgi:hypothetical protein
MLCKSRQKRWCNLGNKSIIRPITKKSLAINHITNHQEGMASRIIEAKGVKMAGGHVNNYNNQGYNRNQGFRPSNDAKEFCCRKEGHVRKDYLVWKCICEEETIGTKPKVGVNVNMVDWDQPLVDVSVTTQSTKALLVDEEQGNTKTSPTRR